MLCLRVCQSICPPVTSRSSIEMSERIKLVFGTEAFFDLFCMALFKYLQKEGHLPLQLRPELRTYKISPCTARRPSQHVVN